MTTVAFNSLVTLDIIINQKILPTRRKQILSYIAAHPGMTRKTISLMGGFAYETVCGRVNELLKHGLIEEYGLDCRSGFPRSRLRLTGNTTVKPLPKKEKRVQPVDKLLADYRMACIENYYAGDGPYNNAEPELKAKILDRIK